jgi:hypothetical protein
VLLTSTAVFGAQPTAVGLVPPPTGCTARNYGMIAPAYLAVNDPCLNGTTAGPARGDGQIEPATIMMQSGSAAFYLAHTAQILVNVTTSTTSPTMTISPCLARPEWSGKGVVYRIYTYGAGATSTITANALSTTNVIHVASGGTSVPLYAPLTDTTTPGNIPAGTWAIATTATTITTNNAVTVASSDVVQYAATKNNQVNSVGSNGCTLTLDSDPTTAVTNNLQYITVTPANGAAGPSQGTTAVSAVWNQWRYDQCSIAKGSASQVCPPPTPSTACAT